jgi:hypothetical protein
MVTSDREAGELTQALRDLKDEVMLLRTTVKDLDAKFVTRLEFRTVGLVLTVATAIIGIISFFKGNNS